MVCLILPNLLLYGWKKTAGGDIVKVYGYSNENKSSLMELSECTLECTLAELEEIILFMTKYKIDLENGIKDGLWIKDQDVIVHRHYNSSPKKQSFDLIIASRLGKTGDGSLSSDEKD